MEIQEFFIRSILREIKTSEMVLMPHLISRKILVKYSQIEETQCGNYGNLLPYFFGKNFVKPTDVVIELLNS